MCCVHASNGVVWNAWDMDHTGVDNAVAVGGTFKSDGCGPRKYAVSVQMKDMCVACVWGCHFVFGFLLASYILVGVPFLKFQVSLGFGVSPGPAL